MNINFLWCCGPARAMAAPILEVSRSHITAHHSRQDSSGRVISQTQSVLPNKTQHSPKRNACPRRDSNPQSKLARGRSRHGHFFSYLFFVSVLCCQVEVSATSWSLVQRSPTDCDASLCVLLKPQEWGGHGPRWAPAPQDINVYIYFLIYFAVFIW